MLYIVDRGCDKLNFSGDQGRSIPPLQTGLVLPLWSTCLIRDAIISIAETRIRERFRGKNTRHASSVAPHQLKLLGYRAESQLQQDPEVRKQQQWLK